MKQCESMSYNTKTIKRKKNTTLGRRRYTAVHYVRVLDPAVYRTKEDAMEAIDVAIAARLARRRTRDEKRGLAEIGALIDYRGRQIERISDGWDGTKRYRVSGMGVFNSIDAAIAKIDFAASALDYIENRPTVTAAGFNRNLEK